MNRPIKFRAWDKETKEIFTLSSISWKGDVMWVSGTQGENKLEYEIVKPSVFLMQFTGLLDKKGKEIYEGDIVEYVYLNEAGRRSGSRRKVLVAWKNSKAICGWPLGSETRNYVVIGNIHENPELLAPEK